MFRKNIFKATDRYSALLTPFKISAWQKRRSWRILVGDRNGRGCVHDPWINMHWKYDQSQMCGSYKLLYGLLNWDWAYFFDVRRSRVHCRLRLIGRGSTTAIGTDRGRQFCPKTDISASFRRRIERFSPASISIANRNRPRSSSLPRGNCNWVGLLTNLRKLSKIKTYVVFKLKILKLWTIPL